MPRTRSAVAPTSSSTAAAVRDQLASLATDERAASTAGFFKNGEGQYGAGDTFIGVSVPNQRLVAKAHKTLPLEEIALLLDSGVHEHRLTALLILVLRYQRGDDDEKRACFDFYLAHLGRVNNWDLVDSSAPQIVGDALLGRPLRERKLLDRLARSKSLWERRVAMVATQALIRAGQSEDALRIAEALLGDEHDLIHKAVGWMLREVGERVDVEVLRAFLSKNAGRMPRTALRYAIEHFSDAERKRWMAVPRVGAPQLRAIRSE